MTNGQFIQRVAEFEEKCRKYFLANFNNLLGGSTEDLVRNLCGSCTVCCVRPAIHRKQYEGPGMPPTPDKPAGEKCRHCNGSGCTVYSVRPEICRGYICLWKTGLVDHRPDESGVAWSLEPDYTGAHQWVLLGHCEDPFEMAARPEIEAEMRRFMQARILGLRIDSVVLRSNSIILHIEAGEDGKLVKEYVTVRKDDPLKVHGDISTLTQLHEPA